MARLASLYLLDCVSVRRWDRGTVLAQCIVVFRLSSVYFCLASAIACDLVSPFGSEQNGGMQSQPL